MADGLPAAGQKDCFRALAALYSSWNEASPGRGYDAKAAEWQRKLDAVSTPLAPCVRRSEEIAWTDAI